MNESPTSHIDLYKGHFVVMEIGGKSKVRESLLNNMSLADKKNPLYIGVDMENSGLGTIPDTDAAPAAMLHRNVTSKGFIEDASTDGKIDRLFALNVFSLMYPDIKEYTEIPEDAESTAATVIRKISRMLKPDGMAVIGEWYTPGWAYNLQHLDFSAFGLLCHRIETTEEAKELFNSLGVKSEYQADPIKYFDEKKDALAERHPFIYVLTKMGN